MNILLADDHTIVREGLKQFLKSLQQFQSIDEASSGEETFKLLKKNDYDIAIIDVSMPGMNGLDVLRKMTDYSIATPVLMLSVFPEEQYAIQAFRLGAAGYLSKDCELDELSRAIFKIARGGRYIARAFAEKVAFRVSDGGIDLPHQKLSQREFQVMILISKGKSITEISTEINISGKTVSTYRSRILEKMGMSRNAELTMYAIYNSLIN